MLAIGNLNGIVACFLKPGVMAGHETWTV